MLRLPHPIPYQGSKRSLAPTIGRYVPDDIGTWCEPFAGSCEERLRRDNPGPRAKTLIHVALDCRAGAGSQQRVL